MQSAICATNRAGRLFKPTTASSVRHPASAAVQRTPVAQLKRQCASSAAQQSGAAEGSSAAAAGGSGAAPAATSALLQRMLATCSLGDRGTLLLAAALTGGLLLGAVEPALAAGAHGDGPRLLGDIAENEDFWANVLRYISYFFSVLLGTAYIAVKPLIELMKKPTTAVLVVAGVGGLVYFVSFTVQAMLGVTEPLDYTASSIVTPML